MFPVRARNRAFLPVLWRHPYMTLETIGAVSDTAPFRMPALAS